jgi:hypothetical protein
MLGLDACGLRPKVALQENHMKRIGTYLLVATGLKAIKAWRHRRNSSIRARCAAPSLRLGACCGRNLFLLAP